MSEKNCNIKPPRAGNQEYAKIKYKVVAATISVFRLLLRRQVRLKAMLEAQVGKNYPIT